MAEYHIPVMLKESIGYLDINPDGVYVDATFGGGGHTKGILEKLSKNGKVFGFDQDADAAKNVIDDSRFVFVNQNFSYLKNYMLYYNCVNIDGLIVDLGVSSYQIDTPSKGFSYHHPDELLDMRMSSTLTKTAANILNHYSAEELKVIMSKYGEVRLSKTIADTIVEKRINAPILKVKDLNLLLEPYVSSHKKYAFFSKVYQALRIEVNNELEALFLLCNQAKELLKPGGRFVAISYHSLEDRIIKNFLKTGNTEGVVEKDFYGNQKKYFSVLTKKPIISSEKEIQVNSRARSAKLRAAIKI
jgi:16S rRNA (cytosine1402-N4)-methyltransferase